MTSITGLVHDAFDFGSIWEIDPQALAGAAGVGWTPGPVRSSPPTPLCSGSAQTAGGDVDALLATGVNADGHREVLGLDVTSGEDGAGSLAFFRGLAARGLSGVGLVTSDARVGLVAAIGAALPGTSWQRCRTHYAVNLMSVTPKSSWPWVRTLLRSVYDQPDAGGVHAQYDRVLDALAEKLPAVAAHLDAARADVLAFTAFPREIWRQIWSNNPVRHEAPRHRGEVKGLPRWAVAAA